MIQQIERYIYERMFLLNSLWISEINLTLSKFFTSHSKHTNFSKTSQKRHQLDTSRFQQSSVFPGFAIQHATMQNLCWVKTSRVFSNCWTQIPYKRFGLRCQSTDYSWSVRKNKTIHWPTIVFGHIYRLCRPTSKRMKGVPFQMVKAVPVDLFPQTNYCELVVLLERTAPIKCL